MGKFKHKWLENIPHGTDYYESLPPEAKEWIKKFDKEYRGLFKNSRDWKALHRTKKLKRDRYNAVARARRDVLNGYERTRDLSPDIPQESPEDALIRSLDLKAISKKLSKRSSK